MKTAHNCVHRLIKLRGKIEFMNTSMALNLKKPRKHKSQKISFQEREPKCKTCRHTPPSRHTPLFKKHERNNHKSVDILPRTTRRQNLFWQSSMKTQPIKQYKNPEFFTQQTHVILPYHGNLKLLCRLDNAKQLQLLGRAA